MRLTRSQSQLEFPSLFSSLLAAYNDSFTVSNIRQPRCPSRLRRHAQPAVYCGRSREVALWKGLRCRLFGTVVRWHCHASYLGATCDTTFAPFKWLRQCLPRQSEAMSRVNRILYRDLLHLCSVSVSSTLYWPVVPVQCSASYPPLALLAM